MEKFWLYLDGWLFGPASARRDWTGFALRLLRYVYAVVRDLTEGQISLRAMGLVYTTLLAVVPLIAFLLSILSIFHMKAQFTPWVTPWLQSLFEPLGQQGANLVTRDILDAADRAGSGAIGLAGFALLVYTAIGTISRVEDSFNFLWRIEHPRSFPRRMMEYLTLLVIGPMLLFSITQLTKGAFSSVPVQQVAQIPFLQRAVTTVMPYVVTSGFFTVLYLLIPNTRVQLRAALLGALVAGVLWAAVFKMFAAFVVSSARQTFVYGSFATFIAALLFVYLGWLILLAGAQLTFYIQNPAYLRIGTRPLNLSAIDLEELALAVMYLVGQAHLRGARLRRQIDLAGELDVPLLAVSRTVVALIQAGLVRGTEAGELLPARDTAQIPVLEVLETARHQGGGQLRRSTPIPAVETLRDNLDATRRSALGGLTLRELIETPRARVLTPLARPGLGALPR